ncbi:Transcriptional regulator, PadR family (modular protein) [Streptantibioticus cattleyicolor NRRL 8057 = DSM 46488]|nr:Transcriptional regulator, PadR family (modular protein) [Streptantibioticus cattleyicolor NRRL 8057 = DSM 46488]
MLGLLARGPASGYDLLKAFEASLANVWPATQSQLYTELGRLTDAGLIAVQAEGPRGRKEYRITQQGREELWHWLTEVEPDPPRRNDALLRVFFLDQVDPGQARAYLERRAAAAAAQEAALLGLREQVAAQDDPLARYGLLSLEYGVRISAAVREWAQWAVEQLDAGGALAPANPAGPAATTADTGTASPADSPAHAANPSAATGG